eukprot:1546068-Amphidinium_carterae.1
MASGNKRSLSQTTCVSSSSLIMEAESLRCGLLWEPVHHAALNPHHAGARVCHRLRLPSVRDKAGRVRRELFERGHDVFVCTRPVEPSSPTS